MTQEEKDTQDWLAILNGQTVDDAALETVKEARVLRAVLQLSKAYPGVQSVALSGSKLRFGLLVKF